MAAPSKETIIARQAEREKMCSWGTPYAPAQQPDASKAPRRTPRQARAAALVSRARINALRLMALEAGN